MDTRCLAVLVAAGEGRRLGRPAGKALAPLAGRPLFMHALLTLWNLPEVHRIALVVRDEDRMAVTDAVSGLLQSWHGPKRDRLLMVSGGLTRQESALLGLEALAAGGKWPDQVAVVHDAARPLASADLFRRVMAEAASARCAVAPALPVSDSLRVADAPDVSPGGIGIGIGGATAPRAREGLWRVQTPQGCPFDALLQAHRAAAASGLSANDDVTLAEAGGIPVRLVEGEEGNFKVTGPADLRYVADLLMRGRTTRAGIGFDVHPLRTGDGVRLGGVLVPCEHKLEGHSDADVAAHAVMDALLGAAGAGDIGLMFPPGDEKWRGADSIKLLEAVWVRLAGRGYLVGNVDVTIMAESPRLSPHFTDMQRNLSTAMGCEPWQVNLKATTTERLGFVGRHEGIAAMAVALLLGPEAPCETSATAPS